jgi:hypothetical protein
VQIPSEYIRPDVSANVRVLIKALSYLTWQIYQFLHLGFFGVSNWGNTVIILTFFFWFNLCFFCEFQLWVHVCFQSDCLQVWLCPLIWCVCEHALLCNTLYSDSCSLQKVSAIQNQEWI